MAKTKRQGTASISAQDWNELAKGLPGYQRIMNVTVIMETDDEEITLPARAYFATDGRSFQLLIFSDDGQNQMLTTPVNASILHFEGRATADKVEHRIVTVADAYYQKGKFSLQGIGVTEYSDRKK